MVPTQELEAYRLSESLILAVYEATDAFPRQAPPRLVEQMRQATTRCHSLILDGCAQELRRRALAPWRSALRVVESLGHLIDRASDQGLLHPDLTLGLLELQSGAVVRLLILLDAASEGWEAKAASPDPAALPLALAA